MRPWHILFAVVLSVSLGCGGSSTEHARQAGATSKSDYTRQAVSTGKAADGREVAAEPPAPPAGGQPNVKGQKEVVDEAKAPAAGQAPAGRASRKIVYNADVVLVVPDLDKGEADLKALMTDLGAFVANSEITGSAGSPRSGHWRVRVPVERFDEFMTGVVKIGVPDRNKADSQDVTDEYYDLEDRIKNKKLEQETLRGYLQEKKATSKLDEILTIEKELSRVRGELDGMEGRLRRLKDITALATVSVTLREVKDYKPPQAPSFGDSVRGTFADSVDLLVRFGQGAAIVAVALAPWLVVLAVVAVPAWQVGRRYVRKSAEAAARRTEEERAAKAARRERRASARGEEPPQSVEPPPAE